MRDIINISLPSVMVKDVETEVKRGKYTSTSEFIRTLIREWQKKKLLAELRTSQKETKEGKGKVLRSLKDLR